MDPSNATSDRGAGSSLALAALVLGIVSLLSGVMPAATVAGVVGVILALALLLSRSGGRAVAWIAILLCLAGFVVAIAFGRLHEKTLVWLKSQQKGGIAFDLWAGRVSPDIAVTGPEGATQLSSLRGRPVVLVFHAPWIDASKAHVSAISVAIRADGDRAVLALVELDRLSPRAGDPPPYDQVLALPTTFFIDASGVIREATTGASRAADLAPFIARITAAAP